MAKINLALQDILGITETGRSKRKDSLPTPNEFYRNLLDYALERSYLNNLPERERFVDFKSRKKMVSWLRVIRLPVHPDEAQEYDLLSRWQSVLTTLHAWGHHLIFLLQRSRGETNLYLGTISSTQEIASKVAVQQFKEAASSCMPGIDLKTLTDMDDLQNMVDSLMNYSAAGAVTGIPSFRKNTKFDALQTLDQLAFGIRDHRGAESEFSVMVIANPINDKNISQTIAKFRKLGSEIHSEVTTSISDGETEGSSEGFVESLLSMVSCIPDPILDVAIDGINSAVENAFGFSIKSEEVSTSHTVTKEYLDKFAQYAEELTDRHCERLKKGRNLGFWNVGVYALGEKQKDIATILGMLRSIYSGDETYVEPIRIHMFKDSSGAIDIIRKFELVPLLSDEVQTSYADPSDEWHMFGKSYQYVSTPLNTEELSIATSLPRRDVPGLRFVKTAVRFANNPAVLEGDSITLGKVVDIGVVQGNDYKIDPHALVRHAIIAGSTGSGKSTTCKRIIGEVLDRDIPVLIIEPAKDDYVRWAIEYNKKIDQSDSLTPQEKERKKFDIYMPGVTTFDSVRTKNLRLGPFQPAAIKGAPVDFLTRCEQFIAVLNASLPVADILPVIIDEAIFKYCSEQIGEEFLNGESKQLQAYPKLDGVMDTARQLLSARGYDKRVQDDIAAALETRFAYLTRGKRGKILNANNPTDYDKLFSKPVVINVSRIAGSKDKALFMSMLMLAIYEYRASAYMYDDAYRANAQENKLMHLTVIEEAHNLLAKPPFDGSGSASQITADLFSNILSEIRSYGEGIIMVDQIPTRLVPDAIKNSNYKIVHRLTSPDDCHVMAAGLALREDQQSIIPALGIGNAIICGDMDDAAAWVKINQK